MPFTTIQLNNIPNVLSQPRFATYLQHCNNDRDKALALYQWNIELSAAFVVPLHLLEIALRNAVVESLTNVYTSNWPWDQNFILSLPSSGGYKPRQNLLSVARMPNPTMGKVVAELKFVFWEKMFTARHDTRIWDTQLLACFPNAPDNLNVVQLRTRIFNDINTIRSLRNRIAHHEPIFYRNAQDDYDKIFELISWRDIVTADWMNNIQSVTRFIAERP